MQGSNMYKIVGGNQKEYGPVTADEVVQWIAEKRANRQTQALLIGSESWRPLGEFPEFADALERCCGPLAAALPPGATPAPPTGENQRDLLIPAVAVSLCCCPIFGPVAVTLAALADARREFGDDREARALTQRAQTWIWVAMSLGIVGWIAVLLLNIASKK